ncbi:PCMD domain-containing protein [Flammeovirga sp. SubArs3]|uniref:PCMD domain-containing protein n=1 Tax=Flammeovirga sp. SubArs3 TaxID=2995316 RepID=UPI00248B2116|nr:PCMD domain-containing protein [Flammeovirga sp. SubArs3]
MKKLFTILIALFGLSACIKNDIPFPYLFGEILSISMEGQSDQSSISTEHQTVEIKVPYGTDKTQLSIVDFEITEGAKCTPDIKDMTDFSLPVHLTITTYQEYDWTITVIEDDFEINLHHFEIEGQLSARIDKDLQRIQVIIPDTLAIEDLSITTFDYSPNDIIVSPNPFEIHDFSSPVSFFFDDIEWIIEVEYDDEEIEKSGDQILYSNFQSWYYGGRNAGETPNNRKFYIPGEDFDTTPWRTGDVGAADLVVATGVRTVYPYPDKETYEYTTLKTTSTLGVVAAGSLFVGDIKGSGLRDVKTDFGIPFTDNPKRFTSTIQYLPEVYNNELDMCDIYVLLQVREGSGDNEKRYRLATAWYRSDKNMETFETIDIPFLYGNHSDLASYMLPAEDNEMMPEHGFASAQASPTHIIVVYSSSFDGANLKGGVGSELRVKEFELKY